MNPLVIIPTIYGMRRKKGASDPVATYDHPNAPGRAEELKRCLSSLTRVENIGPIVILVSSEPNVRAQAIETVEHAASAFPQLDVLVITESEAQLIHQRLEQLGAADMRKEIGLTGYAAIRNLGLVVAHILGFDAVVFLDDDEVVDDPAFLRKGVYGLGKLTKRGVPILVKTGFYYNRDGNYRSMSQDRWYNHFWQQGKAFNAWIERAMKGPRLSRSNHVCGGCLALHVEAFKRLAFDPWIPRGEDLDYLLSLHMYGSDIWFDNQWSLVHLPPKTASEGERFRQDIYRWLYEFRKMEYSRTQIDLLQVSAASLEPYPGPFLKPGITRRIKITSFLRSLARPDKRAYRRAARAASKEASEYAQENCARFFEFQFVWPELMQRVAGDKILQAALLESSDMRRKALGIVEKPMQAASIDPGQTGEIRLNIAD